MKRSHDPRFVVLGALAILAGAMWVAGCAGTQHSSQTEPTAVEVREFDASYDATFGAIIAALFDDGYTLSTSDKRGGVLVAYRPYSGGVRIKLDRAGPRRTAVGVSTSAGGRQRADKDRTDALLRLIERRLSSRPVAGSS